MIFKKRKKLIKKNTTNLENPKTHLRSKEKSSQDLKKRLKKNSENYKEIKQLFFGERANKKREKEKHIIVCVLIEKITQESNKPLICLE